MQGRTWDPRLTHGCGLAVAVVLICATWLGVYEPTVARLRQRRGALQQTRQQRDAIEQQLRVAGGEETWIFTQHLRLNQLHRRLPPSDQVPGLLELLAYYVAESNLHVVNVDRGNLQPAIDAQGQPVRFNGRSCMGLPVSLTVQGRYHQLITCLEQLTTQFPCLVRVARVREQRSSADGVLDATMDLVLYVVE